MDVKYLNLSTRILAPGHSTFIIKKMYTRRAECSYSPMFVKNPSADTVLSHRYLQTFML